MVNGVRFLISKGENFTLAPKRQFQSLRAQCSKIFITVKKKNQRNLLTQISEAGRECPTHLSYQGFMQFFNWLLRIERSSQTHSHSLHFKMTGLVRRFSRRKNISSSRLHCCYIITGTEFKEKHILEQDELFCCEIISPGLKENHPFLLLENSRLLSPPPGSWTSYQSTQELTLSPEPGHAMPMDCTKWHIYNLFYSPDLLSYS